MRFALRLTGLTVFAALGSGVLLPDAARGKTIRVTSSAALQQAIQSAKSGDTIELAGGSYATPKNGFNVSNLGKALTLRSVAGAQAVLEGDGVRPLVRFENNQSTRGKQIVFRDLHFRGGRSASRTSAGGVTLAAAKARFVHCLFSANSNTSSGAGGALRLARGSSATLLDTTFRQNQARSRGGALEVVDSTLVMNGGGFEDNGTNRPGHSARAIGGAVYLLNTDATFGDVLFARNGSGWVGGAMLVFGQWQAPSAGPASSVLLERVTFEDNHARRAAGEPEGGRNEGGAIHAEDHAEVVIRSSVFRRNSAHVGGALHSYRAVFDVSDSVFIDNQARNEVSQPSVGGTIAIESNDQSGPSTQNGAINRPPGALALRRSLVQGPAGQAGARTGGCLFVDGDLSRQYGTGSVPKDGTLAVNRAPVLIERSILTRCSSGVSGVPLGGGLRASLADVAVADSLVFDSRSPESGGGGGALALVEESSAFVADTTFAANFAERFGGAIFLSGSSLDVRRGRFYRNALRPAAASVVGESRGAGIYTLPRGSQTSHGAAEVRGQVADSTFSSSAGLALWDVESPTDGVINDLRYDANRFFESSFGADVYLFSREAPNARTPAELNALIISRAGGPSTKKSSAPNLSVARPREGVLLAVQAAGSPTGRTGPFLAFAWEGTSAVLDGAPLAARQGVVGDVASGRHELAVAGGATLDADVD